VIAAHAMVRTKAASKLHVFAECKKTIRTNNDCEHGDFCAILEGGGESYAEAVSFNSFEQILDGVASS
jgi:hypothetical protein